MAIADGAEVWDSGWRRSEQSANVEYKGLKLSSDCEYFWTVEVKASDGKKAKSEAARFQTGLMAEEDWGMARWIAMEQDGERLFPFAHLRHDGEIGCYKLPEFKKEFDVRGEIARATAYVCGLGHFDFFANGEKVGNHFLDPGWTLYNKEAMYVSFDVTSMLRKGANTLGVMLGNGFYNIPNERYYKITGSFGAPKLKMRLVVHYKDGTSGEVVSDGTWSVRESGISYSSIYGGESLSPLPPSPKGEGEWKSPFIVEYTNSETNYNSPSLFGEGRGGALKNQFTYPLTVRQTLPPMTITRIDSTRTMYDFGQNISGIVRLKVKGKAGAKVVIWPAELLKNKETVDQEVSGRPYPDFINASPI